MIVRVSELKMSFETIFKGTGKIFDITFELGMEYWYISIPIAIFALWCMIYLTPRIHFHDI